MTSLRTKVAIEEKLGRFGIVINFVSRNPRNQYVQRGRVRAATVVLFLILGSFSSRSYTKLKSADIADGEWIFRKLGGRLC